MALRKWGYIFLGPGFDPKQHSVSITNADCEVQIVGLDFKWKEQVVEVAKELVKNGAQIIELCGGFGPTWIAKVSQAIGDNVPVGGVGYGPEYRATLLKILDGTKEYRSPAGISFSAEKSL